MDKEIKRIVRDLERSGFECEQTARSHIKVRREGRTRAVLPLTPGRGRAIANLRRTLIREGLLPAASGSRDGR